MVGSLVALVLAAVPGGVAAADSVGDTQAQISALQAQVAAGAAHIHTLTEAYQQANLQASTLGQQLTTDNATLQAMRAKMAASLSTLRNQAIRSYTGTHADNTYAALGGSTDPAVGAEYLTVASGNVTDSVDQLKVQQSQLQAQAATVKSEQEASNQALRAAADARSSALALANNEQAQLDQLQSILQTQVAARQQAEAAAAQAAAANRTAAVAAPKPAAPAATQGAPVNGGLVASVQQVVAPAPAPAASSPAPSSPAPGPAPAPAPAASGGGGAGGNWARLRQCESGGNYQENTGNGFYGAYQFSASTWSGLGYPGRPDQEPPSMQDAAAMQLQARSGWGQWPACSAALGLS